jgi:hypothetical protein
MRVITKVGSVRMRSIDGFASLELGIVLLLHHQPTCILPLISKFI